MVAGVRNHIRESNVEVEYGVNSCGSNGEGHTVPACPSSSSRCAGETVLANCSAGASNVTLTMEQEARAEQRKLQEQKKRAAERALSVALTGVATARGVQPESSHPILHLVQPSRLHADSSGSPRIGGSWDVKA